MREITISLTNYCNSNCEFCGYKKDIEKKSVSLFSAKAFLKMAKKIGYNSLIITGGGEPLIEIKKFMKLVAIAKRIGMEIRIVTNGYYGNLPIAHKITNYLKNNGVKKITFSIDYDHSKYIPIENSIKAIQHAMNCDINVMIRMINRNKTYKKNMILLKKISKMLDGIILRISHSNFFIYSKKYRKFIHIIMMGLARLPTYKNNIMKEMVPCDVQDLILHPCFGLVYSLDANNIVLPCCQFIASNNPAVFGISKITNKKNNALEIKNEILKCILFDRMAFIKLYLAIRKNKKLGQEISKNKFYSQCHFCFWLLQNSKFIRKIQRISKMELAVLTIPIFHKLLIIRLKKLFYDKYFIFLTMVHRELNKLLASVNNSHN